MLENPFRATETAFLAQRRVHDQSCGCISPLSPYPGRGPTQVLLREGEGDVGINWRLWINHALPLTPRGSTRVGTLPQQGEGKISQLR